MNYQIDFLKEDGSLACIFVMDCISDEHAKAVARVLMREDFPSVEIFRDDVSIHSEMHCAKPN